MGLEDAIAKGIIIDDAFRHVFFDNWYFSLKCPEITICNDALLVFANTD
jgi:hypothetical protein